MADPEVNDDFRKRVPLYEEPYKDKYYMSLETTVCGLTITEIYGLKDVIQHLKEDNAALKKALEGFIGRAV